MQKQIPSFIRPDTLHATRGLPPGQVLQYFGSVTHATNERVLAQIQNSLAHTPEAHLHMVVTSAGGPTGSAMSFYETVRLLLRPRLTTIGIGDVDSSGVIIFLAGQRRLVSKRTTMLLHPAGRVFEPGKRFTAAEIAAMAKEDKLKDEQYAALVAENSGGRLTAADVLGLMAAHTVLETADIVRLGLAERVL